MDAAIPALFDAGVFAEFAFITGNCEQLKGGADRESDLIGFAGVPRQALIDPGAEKRDFMGSEWFVFRSGRRHLHVFDEARDIIDERTAGAVAGNDRRAVLAALESCGAIVEAKAAFGAFGAVAAEATGVEDRANVAGEIDLRGDRRGEAGLQGVHLPFGDLREAGLGETENNADGSQSEFSFGGCAHDQ